MTARFRCQGPSCTRRIPRHKRSGCGFTIFPRTADAARLHFCCAACADAWLRLYAEPREELAHAEHRP